MRKNVIIIGAGIAGPVMALQLKKIGIDATIFESRSETDMGQGAFLGITPNGLNVLKEFIPLEKLKKDYTPGTMRFYNQKGRQIAILDTAYQKEKYGIETLQVKRADLNELTRQAAELANIKIHYGKRGKSFSDKKNVIEVEFEDGDIIKGDMLIAGDGVFSTIRKTLFPEADKPRYTKNISTGGFAHLAELSHPADSIHMTFGERGFFAYSVTNHGEVWWFNNYYREREPSKEESGSLLKEEIKEQLLKIHKNDDPLFSKIIKASEEIIAYPVYDIPKLQKWYKGNVCLIGDAAHATSPHVGQGASLALEDTVVLADCLNKFKLPETAFGKFQQARQKRVEKIIAQARKIGDAKSKPNPVATWMRDKLLGFFIKSEIKKLDWIYGYRPGFNF